MYLLRVACRRAIRLINNINISISWDLKMEFYFCFTDELLFRLLTYYEPTEFDAPEFLR